MGIIVGFALCFQRIKDKNLTLDSHLFSPLFLRRTHVSYVELTLKKVCEWCGNVFYAQKVTTRYCSHTCNSRAYKANKRKERVKAAEALTYRTIQEKPIEQLKDRPFLSIAETATLLGLSLQGVYKQIYAGRLRASKITNRLSVVRREDIERMLAERLYEKRQPRDAIVITELYTTDEVCDTQG